MIRTAFIATALAATLGVGVALDGRMDYGLDTDQTKYKPTDRATTTDPTITVTGDTKPSVLEVNVSGTPTYIKVSGDTTLPDWMHLTVTIRKASGHVVADEQTRVRDGHYSTGKMINYKGRFTEGTYQIAISSPIMDLQPRPVTIALGSNGNKLPGSIRRQSTLDDYVYYVVDHSVKMTMKSR